MTNLPELKLRPDSSSYSVKDGTQVVSTQLDGGAGRYRRDILGATSRVSVTWICNPDEYQYLRSFYRATLASGALPFNVGLLLDEPEITIHKAYFAANSIQLQSQKGLTYIVGAELEVYPRKVDQFDFDYVAVFDDFGSDFEFSENIFDTLMNFEFPLDLKNE